MFTRDRTRLTGIYTAIVTPFDSRGRVDLRWMERHLEFQRASGVDGVVACGTNGEGQSLSVQERRDIVDFLARRRGRLKLIVGAGSPSLSETVEFTRYCQSRKADAVLVLPPYFDRDASEPGLVGFFSGLAARVRIPIILYSIPQLTGIPITPSIVRGLRRHRNIVGVKESSGDMEALAALAREFPDLAIYNGFDPNIQAAIQAGARGVISGSANVFPGPIVQLAAHCRAGQDAGEMQQCVTALSQLTSGLPARAATKYALRLLGMPPTHVRQPELELTPGQQLELQTRMGL